MSEELDLIKIYEDASENFYNDNKNTGQKSKHWKRYDFKKFNLDNLKNFRSKGNLSEGLDDGNTDKNFSFNIFADIVRETTEDYLINNLPKKNIGNCDSFIEYKNIFIDYNKLIHIYWFWILEKEVLKKDKISNICEIGGGYGSLSELFLKNYNSKVFLIDLPEANLMSTYYLKETFPEKNFFLFNKYQKTKKLSYEDFAKNDIIILPPNCKIDKKIKFDFFINTRSMMEMNFDVIKKYFDFIHEYSHNNTYFLNINRYEKASVGYPIRISEYPYDDNWKVLVSRPSFNQKWIHFLLTKRSFEKNEGNISYELEKIKQIGRQFYGSYIDYSPNFIFLKKMTKKFLKLFYGIKILNKIGQILFKIGTRLKNLN